MKIDPLPKKTLRQVLTDADYRLSMPKREVPWHRFDGRIVVALVVLAGLALVALGWWLAHLFS